MKKERAFMILAALLSVTVLLSACQTVTQNTSPSASGAAASAALTPSASAPSVTADASTLPQASPHPVSPNIQPVSPSAAVSETPNPSASLNIPAATKAPDLTIASPLPSLKPTAFQFVEKTYKDGPISIKYPQITGCSDKTAQDQLNKLIADAATRDLATIKGETDLTAYELVYTVSLNTPGVVSVYFDGYSNYKQAAHPSQFFYSVTLDVKKLQTVTLSQLVTVTPDFLRKLPDGAFRSAGGEMSSDYVSAIKDYMSTLDPGFWVNELKNADTPGHDASSYLTPDALGISVSVAHVLGDHIEVLLKFSDLQGYQTDNPLWKEIEK